MKVGMKLRKFGKKKRLDVGNKVIKHIITGSAIPKSLGFIELEKNYALLANIMSGMVDRLQVMEIKMEKMEKKMVEVMRAKKKSKF